MTKPAVRGRILSVLCDVCGRDNPDRLLYCQDCGKRLKAPPQAAPAPAPAIQQEIAAPAPPPIEAAPAPPPPPQPTHVGPTAPGLAPARAAEIGSVRPSAGGGPITGTDSERSGRRSRPEAPAFSFGPASGRESVAVPSQPSGAPINPPGFIPVPVPAPPPPVPSVEPAHAASAEPARAEAAQLPCSVCGSLNPASYRFCAVCGGTVPRAETSRPAPKPSSSQPNMAAVAAPASTPAVTPVRAAPDGPVVPPPSPSNGGATSPAGPTRVPGESVNPIAVSAVVPIAEPAQPRVTVFTCARCQGQNDGLARFCKYCGAPLANGLMAQQGAGSMHGAPAPVIAAQPAAPLAGMAPVSPSASEKTGPHPLVKGSEASRLVPPARGSEGGQSPSASALGVPAHLLGQQAPSTDTIQTRAPDFRPEGAPAGPPPAPPPPAQPAAPVPAPPAGAPRAIPAAVPTPMPSPHPVASPAMNAGVRQRMVPHVSPGASAGKVRTARLVVVVEDGSDGKAFDLKGPVVVVGRTEGDVILFDDPYVSPRHARILERDGQWLIQDLHSTNGVYLRLRGRRPLESGDLILLGSQVLQFQLVSDEERQLGAASQHGTRVFGSKPVTRLARLDQRTVSGLVGDIYYVYRDETILGRETGDIVFTSDAFLSRRHAALRREPATSRFHLEDLDSSNGTYVAIGRETALETGDRVRIGQHLFRFESGS